MKFLNSWDALSFESNLVVSTLKSAIELSVLSCYFLWCLFFLWCFFFFWDNLWCLSSIAFCSFSILFLSAYSSCSFSEFSYCFFWTSSTISSSADFDYSLCSSFCCCANIFSSWFGAYRISSSLYTKECFPWSFIFSFTISY